MTDQESRDPIADFFELDEEIADRQFVSDVMAHAPSMDRRAVVRRVMVAIVIALATIPLEGFAVALSSLFLTTVVELNDSLVSELLAPINTVGGLLSIVLFVMRAVYKRLFRH